MRWRWLGGRTRWPRPVPGGRARLRPLVPGDVERVRRWLEDLELVSLAFGVTGEPAGLESMARSYCDEIARDGRNVLAVESLEGELLGFVRFSLWSGLEGPIARVGILLGPRRWWGSGLGSEVMRGLLAYLFEVREVAGVELDTAAFNLRAQRCFEKCGFLRRGDLAVHPRHPEPRPPDKVWMELDRERWLLLQQDEPSA